MKSKKATCKGGLFYYAFTVLKSVDTNFMFIQINTGLYLVPIFTYALTSYALQLTPYASRPTFSH